MQLLNTLDSRIKFLPSHWMGVKCTGRLVYNETFQVHGPKMSVLLGLGRTQFNHLI